MWQWAAACLLICVGGISCDKAPATSETVTPTVTATAVAQPKAPQMPVAVKRFCDSTQGFVKEFKSLRLRQEQGISLSDYQQKVGELTDALAQLEEPPPDNSACRLIASKFHESLTSFSKATRAFQNELKNKADARAESRRRLSGLGGSVSDGFYEERLAENKKERQELWEAAVKSGAEGIEALDSLMKTDRQSAPGR